MIFFSTNLFAAQTQIAQVNGMMCIKCQKMVTKALQAASPNATVKVSWPEGVAVSSYEDKAEAVLGKNSKGQMAVTKITLHPVVGFEGDFSIGDQEMKEMHDRSHRYCFVANSLSDEVGFEVVL